MVVELFCNMVSVNTQSVLIATPRSVLCWLRVIRVAIYQRHDKTLFVRSIRRLVGWCVVYVDVNKWNNKGEVVGSNQCAR